jgi:hypothetical protein
MILDHQKRANTAGDDRPDARAADARSAGNCLARQPVSVSLEALLGQFGGERALACHLALLQLRRRVEQDLVQVCLLAAEVHDRGHWSHVRRADNRAYESEEAYLTEVLGVSSFRSAAKRIAIGRLIGALTEGEREPVARALADVGLAKATVLLPAIEGANSVERERWFGEARRLPVADLQEAVSRHLQAKPRGRPDADRLYRVILGAMPTLEDRELCERLFRLGHRLLGPEATSVGILRAAFQEVLPEWEPRAQRGE